MKARYISSFCVLILCITFSLSGLYGQEEEMKEAALIVLKEWKRTFSDDQVRKLGFDNKADFKAAELGPSFKLYTVSPDAIMRYEEGSEFDEMVTETNYCVYPVISGGKNKALLWMVKKEDKWQVARMGSSKLAKTILSTEGTIRNQISERGLEGARPPKFVRVYQLYLDFFFVKAAEKEYIIPMYTIPALRVEGSKFYTPAELMLQWKEQLKKMPTGEKREKEMRGV